MTKNIRDLGVLPLPTSTGRAGALKVPAPLACYWLGRSELEQQAPDDRA